MPGIHRNFDEFRDVLRQFHAKRAIEVAMAGVHNILLISALGDLGPIPRNELFGFSLESRLTPGEEFGKRLKVNAGMDLA